MGSKATPAKKNVSSRAKRILEDEADYRFSQKGIKEGKAVPISKVLTELGYVLER